jgi:hypothetical protein
MTQIHPCLIFTGKAIANLSEGHYWDSIVVIDTHLAMLTNIREGWKWVAVTNTLAYYHLELIGDVKKAL